MKSQEKNRYSRQELVIGSRAQRKLSTAKVAVVGLGAIGSHAAELLCRAGIGSLVIVDRDTVEESNLQRQALYAEEDIGKEKAKAALQRLKAINSKGRIASIITDINHKNVEKILRDADIILDCTDNLYTRFLINDFAKKSRKPWVYAGCISQEGSVALLAPNSPCFRCFTQEAGGLDTCDTLGILSTASSMTASIQVQLALQWIIGDKKGNAAATLYHIDMKTMRLSALQIKKDDGCRACNGKYDYLNGTKEPRTLKLQCSNLYQFFVDGMDMGAMGRKAKKAKMVGGVKEGKGFLIFNNISMFENGRIMIKANSLKQAKSLLSRFVGN